MGRIPPLNWKRPSYKRKPWIENKFIAFLLWWQRTNSQKNIMKLLGTACEHYSWILWLTLQIEENLINPIKLHFTRHPSLDRKMSFNILCGRNCLLFEQEIKPTTQVTKKLVCYTTQNVNFPPSFYYFLILLLLLFTQVDGYLKCSFNHIRSLPFIQQKGVSGQLLQVVSVVRE